MQVSDLRFAMLRYKYDNELLCSMHAKLHLLRWAALLVYGYCIHKEPLYSTKGRDDITTSKGRRVAQNAFSKIHLGTARFFQTLVVSKFDH